MASSKLYVEHLDESTTTSFSVRVSDIIQESFKHHSSIHGYTKIPLVSLEDAIEPLVLYLGTDIRNYVSIAKQHQDISPPANGLTPDESASILFYLMEWQPYDQCLSFVLNSTLRSINKNRKDDTIKSWYLYLKLLLTSLSKLPSVQSSVYRAIKRDLSKYYPTGKTFTWWGFSSCTSSIDVLKSEPLLGTTGPRTIFEIECGHSGKDLSRHSFRPTEQEVVLLPATHFQVVGRRKSLADLHIIRLKQVELPFSLLLHKVSSPGTQVRGNTSIDDYHNAQLIARIAKYESGSLLNLSQQHLTDLDMLLVVDQAIIKKQCTQLNLSSNWITAQGAQVIANSISSSHLQNLDLGFNYLTDNGVRSLVQSLMIPNNTTLLTNLYLPRNSITNEGARHLAQMLESTGNTITHLSLSYNEITGRGMQLLATAIGRDNSKLEALSLVENPLGDECVNAIVDMLERNRSLIVLNIKKTNLSLTSKARLKQIARRKPFFHLSLSGNVAEKVLMRIL
jgi:hypothetical protein